MRITRKVGETFDFGVCGKSELVQYAVDDREKIVFSVENIFVFIPHDSYYN